MAQELNGQAQVLSGRLRNVKVTNTTAEVFFRAGDREGMAATGVAAAALGLSGAAAGMVAMSMEEMSEPVSQVSFDIDGKHVEALLWNWPFKEEDEVQVVVEPSPSGSYTGFAVLDPREQIIVLYPHVSAGGVAHWKNVIRLSSLVSAALVVFIYLLVMAITYFPGGVRGDRFYDFAKFMLLASPLQFLLFFVIGCRMGRRFTAFVRMAEPIFAVLGWKNVRNISLRKMTKAKKKPTDPPAMGDSYFRY
ncbi:putative type VI secretion system effector [Stenotrophomonas tumulicola]|uniref:Transmembrane protein n=1 Tax=Stenotrophomonas tumulicola TaxID=1685415 RepID=A0A7W3IH27_9GAMM|nr:hypothetical protein [Stenotrophomonas tumulicola]